MNSSGSIKLTYSNILAGLAGITSDANSLVNFARNAAQRHLFTYDEDIPVEMLVQRLCDMKQGYTQYGGKTSDHLQRAAADHQVFVHSVFPCCTWDGTPFTVSSYTIPTLLEITLGGKQPVSEPTILPPRVC